MPLVHKLLFLLQGDILNNVQHFDVFILWKKKLSSIGIKMPWYTGTH